jgi:hypothetical protein
MLLGVCWTTFGGTSGLPQVMQNWLPGSLGAPQYVQFMICSSHVWYSLLYAGGQRYPAQ